jgi:hypothetical protein
MTGPDRRESRKPMSDLERIRIDPQAPISSELHKRLIQLQRDGDLTPETIAAELAAALTQLETAITERHQPPPR